VRFKGVFDTIPDRRRAARELTGVFLDAMAAFPALEGFVVTYETWRDEILQYFDARQTSAGVEGVNHKARVAIHRAYGLKSADSLWTRLILDLNRARDTVSHTIAKMRSLVAGFRAIFSPLCT
jgi:Transposase